MTSLSANSNLTTSEENLLIEIERKLDHQEFEGLSALLDSARIATARGAAADASHRARGERLRYFINHCRFLMEQEESRNFQSMWKEAIQLADPHSEKFSKQRARLLHVKGFFFARSNLDTSIVYCDSALQVLGRVEEHASLLETQITYAKAVAFYSHALPIESIEQTTKALQLADSVDPAHQDSVLWGDLYNLRAALHFGFQEFEDAIIWLERFRKTQPLTPFFEARYLGNLAAIHYVKYNFQRAIEVNGEAIRIRLSQQGTGSTMRLAENYTNQAQFYLSLEMADSAAKYMEKALDIRRNKIEEQNIAIGSTEHSLANIYMLQGKMTKARLHMERAARIYKEHLSPYARTLGDYYDVRSSFHEAIGEYSLALFYRQEGLRVTLNDPDSLQGNDNPLLESIILPSQALGHLIAKAGIQLKLSKTINSKLLDESIATAELAQQIMERMRTDIHSDRFHWTLGKFVQPLHELMINAYLKRHASSGQEENLYNAFQVSNDSKAAMLKRLQRESKVIEHVAIPDSLRHLEVSLKKRIWRLETASKLIDAMGNTEQQTKATALEDSITNLTSRYRRLKLNIESSIPAGLLFQQDSAKLDIRLLQSTLSASGSSLLELFTSGDSLHIFALTQDSLLANTVRMDSVFNKHYSTFKNNISGFTDDYQQFSRSASALYDSLLRPFEQHLGESQLIIIPDQRFFDFPFSALLTERPTLGRLQAYSSLPFLSNKRSLSYSYSATLLYAEPKRSSEKKATNSFLGIAPGFEKKSENQQKLHRITKLLAAGDSTNSSAIPPLPYSITEVETIADIFLKSQSYLPSWLSDLFTSDVQVKIRESANETLLFSGQLNHFSHIHISTHGFYDEQNPALSGFILSPDKNSDGIILPGEIYSLELSAELVVLNGCESGRGDWSAGEGLIGPCQAFLHSGARNVLVALWKTENRSSSFFFKAFYEALLSGGDKLTALRAARVACQQSEDFQHPFFWAGFILVGQSYTSVPSRS
ncbi:MAG: CHAT domain-containing protein [Calditrichia bacterium]